MNIRVKQELEATIKEKVRSGQYDSPEQVIEHALEALAFRDDWEARRFCELKQLIDAGLASSARGESRPVNLRQLKIEAREQRAKRRRKGA